MTLLGRRTANLAATLRRDWIALRWRVARSTRDTVTVRTVQGNLTVSTRDQLIGRALYCYGHFQHDTVTRSLGFLREKGLLPPHGKGTVLDVGANMGVISVGMLVAGEFERAVGIEPDRQNFELLQKNVAQNGLADHYTAIRAAATDRRCTLRLSLSADNLGDHRVSAGTNGVEVDGVPLDELADPGSVSLLWIDIQGHEGFALAGAPRLLATGIPAVMEVCPQTIEESGMGVRAYGEVVARHWTSFWVFRQCGRFVEYPVSHVPKFCEELGNSGGFDDVIFTRG